MKNRDLKKIEEKFSDIDVSDGVLDKARFEMQNIIVKQKSAVRFKYKILLSCAASLALCLAIILPITLSSFKSNNKFSESDNDYSVPQSPNDAPSASAPQFPNVEFPPDGSAAPSVSEAQKYSLKLAELEKATVYNEEDKVGNSYPIPPSAEDPTDTEIVYLFHYKYAFENLDIISEEKYSVDGNDCVVYTLYDMKYTVDVLAEYARLNSEYSVENIKFNYKVATNCYLADVIYGQKRYCFKLNCKDQSTFEAFCKYFSDKISR